MNSRRLPLLFAVPLLAVALPLASPPASADVSHARVIRLSTVEGDVRFARDFHGKDPLADGSAVWETAQLNLPIRQGYVLATDSGRAEVEFENGAMAFLDSNTVLEFYDLSLQDGARTTRLVLRQGTATFYVNPERGEYFSVTGGDFTGEAAGKSRFRVDNFDDGSNLAVESGHVNLLRQKGEALALNKGQSFTMKAGDEASGTVGRLSDDDGFDRWVSGHIDAVTTANNASLQYTGGAYDAGLADLYTYGSWFPVAGYGYGWRPYGVGFGWCPFDGGGWYNDPFFGWGFVGYQPWGWLPYHYGGWIFEPGIGWIWTPGFGGFGIWRPATGVFVRGRNGLLGVVPVHPLDVRGKTPLNMTRGVFPVSGGAVGTALPAGTARDWKVLKSPPKDAPLNSVVARAAAPQPVSRTLVAGTSGQRIVTLSKDSSIVYDAKEHRFVNSASASARTEAAASTGAHAANGEFRNNGAVTVGGKTATERAATPPSAASARVNVPQPSRTAARAMTPPPAPGSRGGAWGGSRGSSSGGWGGASSGASRGGAGSIGGAHPSGGGGGGRPH
jgi:hypothetical protein